MSGSNPNVRRVVAYAAVAAVTGLAPASVLPTAAVAASVRTTQINVAVDGGPADGYSVGTAMSDDGRYVAFDSAATNLVPGDTNDREDVFRRDRRTGVTTRISVSGTGAQGDRGAFTPAISADGRYVAFVSDGADLVPGDGNGVADVFVRDTRAGTTQRVSVTSAGGEADGDTGNPTMSADGRYVVFESYASNLVPGAGPGNVYRHDRTTGTTTLVSAGPDGRAADSGFQSDISPNGRYVVFVSMAPTLVPGDTNAEGDIFRRDLTDGTIVRAGVADDEGELPTGSRNPSVSDNGLVAFWSDSVATAGDTNGTGDVFVRDPAAGTTVQVSVSSTGTPGNTDSGDPALSRTGRYVVFMSSATNLIADDTNGTVSDILRHDLRTGRTTLISQNDQGVQGDSDSANARVTPDGRRVSFSSWSGNLVPGGDPNPHLDLFVTELAG
jgi:Tol biopolymer transport system component